MLDAMHPEANWPAGIAGERVLEQEVVTFSRARFRPKGAKLEDKEMLGARTGKSQQLDAQVC